MWQCALVQVWTHLNKILYLKYLLSCTLQTHQCVATQKDIIHVRRFVCGQFVQKESCITKKRSFCYPDTKNPDTIQQSFCHRLSDHLHSTNRPFTYLLWKDISVPVVLITCGCLITCVFITCGLSGFIPVRLNCRNWLVREKFCQIWQSKYSCQSIRIWLNYFWKLVTQCWFQSNWLNLFYWDWVSSKFSYDQNLINDKFPHERMSLVPQNES